MKTIISILSWTLGILFLLPFTIYAFTESFVGGILLAFATVTTIPITSKYVLQKTSGVKRILFKGLIGFALFFVGSVILAIKMGNNEIENAAAKENQELAEQKILDEKTDYLLNHRDELRDEIFKLYDSGDIEAAFNLANQYKHVDDEKMQKLLIYLETEKIKQYIEKNKKNISDMQYAILFNRLTVLLPDVEEFHVFAKQYSEKVAKAKRYERVAETKRQRKEELTNKIRKIAKKKLGKDIIKIVLRPFSLEPNEQGFLLDIEYTEKTSLTNDMTKLGVLENTRTFIKEINSNPEYNRIKEYRIKSCMDLIDVYGQTKKDEIIALIEVKRDVVNKINWDWVMYEKFEVILTNEGKLWWHPMFNRK